MKSMSAASGPVHGVMRTSFLLLEYKRVVQNVSNDTQQASLQCFSVTGCLTDVDLPSQRLLRGGRLDVYHRRGCPGL